MTEPASPPRYRLSMSIAHQDGVRTYIAYDHLLARPVLAHLLDTAGPYTLHDMEALLALLPAKDAAQIVETAMTERGMAVISLPSEGLNYFIAWLTSAINMPRAASAPSAASTSAPPAAPPPLIMPLPDAHVTPVPRLGSAVMGAQKPPVAGEFTQLFTPQVSPSTPMPSHVASAPSSASASPDAPSPPPMVAAATTDDILRVPRTTPEFHATVTSIVSPPSSPMTPVPSPPSAAATAPPPALPIAPPPPVAAPMPGEFTQMFAPGRIVPVAPPSHEPVAPPQPPPSLPPLALPLPPAMPAAAAASPAPVTTPLALPAAPSPPVALPNTGFDGRGVSSLPPLPPPMPAAAFPPAAHHPPAFAAPSLPAPSFAAPSPVPVSAPFASPPPIAPSVSGASLPPAMPTPSAAVPSVLPPPMFGLPEAGGSAKSARATGPSDYTLVMKKSVPVVATPAAEREATTVALAQKTPTRMTLPVILAINAVVLLTLALILYFVFRDPPAAAPTLNGATSPADSTGRVAVDSSVRRDTSSGGAAKR